MAFATHRVPFVRAEVSFAVPIVPDESLTVPFTPLTIAFLSALLSNAWATMAFAAPPQSSSFAAVPSSSPTMGFEQDLATRRQNCAVVRGTSHGVHSTSAAVFSTSDDDRATNTRVSLTIDTIEAIPGAVCATSRA